MFKEGDYVKVKDNYLKNKDDKFVKDSGKVIKVASEYLAKEYEITIKDKKGHSRTYLSECLEIEKDNCSSCIWKDISMYDCLNVFTITALLSNFTAFGQTEFRKLLGTFKEKGCSEFKREIIE